MPKKQRSAAKKARAIQRATGQNYTTALRSVVAENPARLLAAALRAAGFTETDTAAALDDHLDAEKAAARAAKPLWAAYDRAWETRDSAAVGTSRREMHRLDDAVAEAAAALPVYDNDPFEHEQILVYWIFIALRHIGSGHTEHGLAQAAATVLERLASRSDVTADAIRRSWLIQAIALELTGPQTPAAGLARTAALTLRTACNTPFRGDEEWLACAALIKCAAEQARAVAAKVAAPGSPGAAR